MPSSWYHTLLLSDWTAMPQQGKKTSKAPPVTVGTLLLTYLEGKNGPTILSLVRLIDFERLCNAMNTYRLIRQLHELVRLDDPVSRQITNSAGLSLSTLRAPRRIAIRLTTYSQSEGGNRLVHTIEAQINPSDLRSAILTRTFDVQRHESPRT